MGLLMSLGLPELATLPPRTGKPVSPPTVNGTGAPVRKPVGPVVDEANVPSLDAGPTVKEDNLAVPKRTKTIARSEPGDVAPTGPAAESSGGSAKSVPVSVKVTSPGNTTVSSKREGDKRTVGIQNDVIKLDFFKKTFMVGPVPCYTKAYGKITVGGEISRENDTRGGKLFLKVTGGFELGVGAAVDCITAGPFGAAELSAANSLSVTFEGTAPTAGACQMEICAVGKVGVKIEVDKGPKIAAEAELANWQLFVVTIASYKDGEFSGLKVSEGRDLARLVAALQRVGPAIADAVDKYAPEAVKRAAEEGAKWVAESPTAGKIADTTGKALDTVKEHTGVDVGAGAEKVVQFLVDPEGETSSEANARFTKEAEALNEGHEDFVAAMQASGLDGELRSRNEAEKAEYNAIVDAKNAGGDWKSMIPGLVAKRRTRRFEEAKAEAARKKKAQSDADAAAAADLARRVAAAEARMNAAEQAANGPGNHLNNKAPPGSKARQYWQQGMKFRDPATLRKMEARSLQGEARIAKADEATGLFLKAKVKFEQGAHVTE